MRVAPIGLYFEHEGRSAAEIDLLGGEAAALTHGHELGYLPAVMLVHIIHQLSHNDHFSVLDAVEDAQAAVCLLFPKAKHLPDLLDLTDLAIQLAADRQISTQEAIHRLGQGWVAEETLAIAIYCALRYEQDFARAIITAVNHDGDSDSTGAVTGNILGAAIGMEGIPESFLTHLELKDVILSVADDLFYDCPVTVQGSCPDQIWAQKYIDHSYPNSANA